MIIAVDFDATLANEKTRLPLPGARHVLKALVEKGHEVYILTAREEVDHGVIKDWLRLHGFPQNIEVTNIKKNHTRIIIDDRAIRFTNWNDISKYFL
jgi:5'(3')-deoxyribonucleotidase